MKLLYNIFETKALPENIIGGVGSRSALSEFISSKSFKRVLILTGPNIRKSSSLIDNIAHLIGKSLVGVYDQIQTHAPEDSIKKAMKNAQTLNPDLLVSVGGGSVHDTTKALAILIPSGGDFKKLSGRPSKDGKSNKSNSEFSPLPLISIPTTFSAAEVVGGGAFTEASSRQKLIFGHPKLRALLVILDAEVFSSTPRRILLASGMNAVHHCFEALYSKGSQPITDALALHALRGLIGSLPKIAPNIIKPNTFDYQSVINYASLSGLTYSNSWLGIGHAICHSLGGRCGLSHGEANSVILRYSLRFNEEVAAAKLKYVAETIGISGGRRNAVKEMIVQIEALTELLGVPRSLRELGLKRDLFAEVAKDTLEDPQVDYNPRSVSFDDIMILLDEAWHGK